MVTEQLRAKTRRRSAILGRAMLCGALGVVAPLLLGCGNTVYAIKANSATARLKEAEQVGAAELAPYEFHYAKQHLEKAGSEAAEADYSDAITLVEQAEEYAEKAIRLAQAAHRGAGR